MDLTIFTCGIFFWILYYVFEGSHDVAFLKQIDLYRQKLDEETNKSVKDASDKYERDWHFRDDLEKALVKLAAALLIYLLTDDILFAFQMLAISFFIRVIVHDLVVAIGLGKGISHIGPSEDVAWDSFLRKMKKVGINQYVIKLVPTILLLLWTYVHITQK